jgi:polysaccharide pyruvyl transferase WcaK-like protein
LSWVPMYSLVVASRFHALVLAAACDIPFVGWGTQKKVESFCRLKHMSYTNTARNWDEETLLTQIADRYQTRNKSVILATRID